MQRSVAGTVNAVLVGPKHGSARARASRTSVRHHKRVSSRVDTARPRCFDAPSVSTVRVSIFPVSKERRPPTWQRHRTLEIDLSAEVA
jgi:hypothetical protein